MSKHLDVSVVIPVLNAAAVLPLQLQALSQQDFRGEWEIVIADNGSTDRLVAVIDEWLPHLPQCRVVDASRLSGGGYAKSIGLMHARAELIAFCDADDVVAPGWLTAIVKGLNENDMVTGPLAKATAGQLAIHSPEWLFETLDFDNSLSQSARIGLSVFGGNSGFRRRSLAGYAPDYLFGEDTVVSFRAASAGFTRGWVEEARVIYRQPNGARSVFRRSFGSGIGHAQARREFPDLLVSPSYIKAIGWLLVNMGLFIRADRSEEWAWAAGRLAGRTLESIAPGLYLGAIRAKRARRLSMRGHRGASGSAP